MRMRPIRLVGEADTHGIADLAGGASGAGKIGARVAEVVALGNLEQELDGIEGDDRRKKRRASGAAGLAVAQAQLQVAAAAQKAAELNFEWTEVKAPIAGRISDKKVNEGNLVNGGSGSTTLLATIVSLDPIQFLFEVSESDYLRYTRANLSGARRSSREVSNPVRIRLADETDWTHAHIGKMDFVDNQLDVRTGTIRGRAIVENKDMLFSPGVFGRIQLFAGEVDAILIPDRAVISDQARKIVFALDADDKVVPKPVVLGPIHEGMRVVLRGLSADDRIIVDGIANPAVRPGVKVKPEMTDAKAASN